MAKFPFLSDDWVAEAKKLREELDGAGAPPHTVKMNLVITEVPFGEGQLDAHMDTTGGEVDMDVGHLEDPQLTVTVGYDVAKAIFVDGDPQAGMQAFMAGKIKVVGDMSKLMAMQSGVVDPAALEAAKRIQDITE